MDDVGPVRFMMLVVRGRIGVAPANDPVLFATLIGGGDLTSSILPVFSDGV